MVGHGYLWIGLLMCTPVCSGKDCTLSGVSNLRLVKCHGTEEGEGIVQVLTKSHQWVNLVHKKEAVTRHLCKWLGYTPEGASGLPKNVSSNCSDKEEKDAIIVESCDKKPKNLSDCECIKAKGKDYKKAGIHCQVTVNAESSKNSATIAGIAVLVVLLLIILSAVTHFVICVLYKKKKRKKRVQQETSTSACSGVGLRSPVPHGQNGYTILNPACHYENVDLSDSTSTSENYPAYVLVDDDNYSHLNHQ